MASTSQTLRGPIVPKEVGNYPMIKPKISYEECRLVDFINATVASVCAHHWALRDNGLIDEPIPKKILNDNNRFYSQSLYDEATPFTLEGAEEVFDRALHHLIKLKDQLSSNLCQREKDKALDEVSE